MLSSWLSSPDFVLEQSRWCARLLNDWISTYGREKAKSMIRSAVWVDPAKSIFATAWGE